MPKEITQLELFPQPRLRKKNGQFCTKEEHLIDLIKEENQRLRLERDKFYRMYVSIERDNERLTRELMVLKSKIGDLL